MSLVKVPFLLANVTSAYIASTPPNPSVPADQRPKNITPSERVFSAIVKVYSPFFKYVRCAGSVFELVVILARQWPSHLLSRQILDALIHGPSTLANQIIVSPAFLVGCGLVTSSVLIRILCYRTLGRLFTFEVAVKNDHKLITHGPYSYVRHPGYLASIAGWIGTGITCLSQGSWLTECGILETPAGRVAVWLYGSLFVYGAVTFVMRAPLEDALLKDRFKTQWDEWAKRYLMWVHRVVGFGTSLSNQKGVSEEFTGRPRLDLASVSM